MQDLAELEEAVQEIASELRTALEESGNEVKDEYALNFLYFEDEFDPEAVQTQWQEMTQANPILDELSIPYTIERNKYGCRVFFLLPVEYDDELGEHLAFVDYSHTENIPRYAN